MVRGESMSAVYCHICIDCKHLQIKEKNNGRPVCKASPDGIPYDIWIEKSKPDIDENAPCANGFKF